MRSVIFILAALTASASVCFAAPTPFAWRNADYAAADIEAVTGASLNSADVKSSASSGYTLGPRTVRGAPIVVRKYPSSNEFDGGAYELEGYLASANSYGSALQTLALQSKSGAIKDQDPRFRQQAVDALTGFQGSIHSFQVLFKHLGRDKGLANYNRSSKVQTLLKELVNLHKDTLEAIDCLVYELPYLGPYLGPIVYEIKCLLDLILNALENLADAVLNELEPLLASCIGSYVKSTCSTGFSVAGLCVDTVLGAGVVGKIL